MKKCEKQSCQNCIADILAYFFGTLGILYVIYIVYIFIMSFFSEKNIDNVLNISFNLSDSFWGAMIGALITLIVMFVTNSVNTKNNNKTLEVMKLQNELAITPRLILQNSKEKFFICNKTDIKEYDAYLKTDNFKLSIQNVGLGMAKEVNFKIGLCEEVMKELRVKNSWPVKRTYQNDSGEVIVNDDIETYEFYRYLHEERMLQEKNNEKNILLIKPFEEKKIEVTDSEIYLKKYLINSISDFLNDKKSLTKCIGKDIRYQVDITYKDVLDKEYSCHNEFKLKLTSFYDEAREKRGFDCELTLCK